MFENVGAIVPRVRRRLAYAYAEIHSASTDRSIIASLDAQAGGRVFWPVLAKKAAFCVQKPSACGVQSKFKTVLYALVTHNESI